MASLSSFSTASLLSQPQAQAADTPVQSPPSDTVSSLNFTPAANQNLLVATSWSGDVLCWDTALQGDTPASQPKAATKHEFALDCSWFHDGSKVATCGCDRNIKAWDLASNQQIQIGQHAAPVRAVEAIDPQVGGGSVVASGALQQQRAADVPPCWRSRLLLTHPSSQLPSPPHVGRLPARSQPVSGCDTDSDLRHSSRSGGSGKRERGERTARTACRGLGQISYNERA